MKKLLPFAVVACVAFCFAIVTRYADPIAKRFAPKQEPIPAV